MPYLKRSPHDADEQISVCDQLVFLASSLNLLFCDCSLCRDFGLSDSQELLWFLLEPSYASFQNSEHTSYVFCFAFAFSQKFVSSTNFDCSCSRSLSFGCLNVCQLFKTLLLAVAIVTICLFLQISCSDLLGVYSIIEMALYLFNQDPGMDYYTQVNLGLCIVLSLV